MSRREKLLEDYSLYNMGTDNYYAHPLFRGIKYTDGARDVFEIGEAYWLLDAIAAHATELHPKGNEFLVFKLEVNDENNSAIIRIEDGNDNILRTQEIEFTDFPALSETLWCIRGTIILPAEY